ncbi:CDP-alcohol phosphatidyltransferase family protein [Rubrobacter taiwanensis]|jgi:cardiolipin synthase|uniref:CDP-alcohol phosphatidyltransferase family protein n=1 Tax=Rubrobacter taiwanensis TaxID=185139 RepID=A0A4R1BH94_9ACTN|nr:CDP-alcohol phosphatidyltransferase family protein [Rubrobacter taiwanensis]TCJ16610.1 CDP-alcohol phosphatidyltransferase family protein [Rubrobacter taiwanensis]
MQTSDRILTAANALTLFRLLLVPVILWLLLAERDLLAALAFVAAGVTDFFDGRLARRSAPTQIGQLLDPAADRLLLSGCAVVLAVRGILPVWAVVILVARDLLAVTGGLVFRGRLRVNFVGKLATAALMAALAALIFGLRELGLLLFYGGFVLSLVSGGIYAAEALRRKEVKP